MCHCCTSSTSPSPSPLLILNLPEPLLELIIARLPLVSALSASSTCKCLRSLVLSSKPFANLHRTLLPSNRAPWFFLVGINSLLPHKSQAFAFDPLSFAWRRLPPKCFAQLPAHNQASFAAMDGTFFALAGPRQAQMCLCLSAGAPVGRPSWVVTPPMRRGRRAPLVGGFYKSGTLELAVVVGGVDELEQEEEQEEQQACGDVEIYDVARGTWLSCPPLPGWIGGLRADAHNFSAAALGRRFYVADHHSSRMCVLDVDGRVWARAECERPAGVLTWRAVASEEEGLVMVALCCDEKGAAGVRLFKAAETTAASPSAWRCGEVTEMPPELFEEVFDVEGDGDCKHVALRCSAGGAGGLVYVYSESRFRDYAACVCHLRSGRWSLLPSLPPPISRFDRVICTSSSLPLDSFQFDTC